MHQHAPVDQDLMSTAMHQKALVWLSGHQRILKDEKLKELVSMANCERNSLAI